MRPEAPTAPVGTHPASRSTTPRTTASAAGWVAAVGTLVSALLLPMAAHAARPFATEDAGALERGKCEVEPVVARARAKGQPKVKSASLQLACGVGLKTQLALNTARESDGQDSARIHTLAGKSQLLQGGDNGTSLAVAYGLNWLRAGGSGLQRDGSFINLVATHPLADNLTGHANLGWQHSKLDSLTATTWALALEYKVLAPLDIGVEAFGDDRGGRWIGAGVRWTVNDSLSANAGVATQRGGDRARQSSLGLNFNF